MKFLNKKIAFLFLINFFLLGFNVLPLLAQTANYQLLEPSVVINQGDQTKTPEGYNLQQYLQTAYVVLFVLTITIIIFWIVISGLEYIMSDNLKVKVGGREKLKKAIFGLAIALSSWLLLNLINPDLLKYSLNLNSQP